MTDTPPAIQAKYRALLLARPGEARLRMGASMYATARALVLASILERDPAATPAAIRQALFLRFYGEDFDASTRARILARLAAERGPWEADGPPGRSPAAAGAGPSCDPGPAPD